MPLQERVVRYSSSAGELITKEFDWEKWYGDAGDRAVRTGKNSLAFKRYFANELLKLRQEIRAQYPAKRSAHEIHREERRQRRDEREERSALVQELGRQSLRLRGEGPGRKRGRRPGEKQLVIPSDSNESGEAEVEYADSSEDEDWETDEWSKAEIEGALDLLIQEVRTSPQAKRRRVATKMIIKLIKRHQMARDHIDLLMPSLVERALFVDLSATRRTSETSRLSQLVADIVFVLPEKMSRFGCAKKASQILARKFQLAALLIQSWHRMRVFKRKKAQNMPLEFRVRRRALLLVAFVDTLEQWRRFSQSPAASLTLTDKVIILRILCGLVGESNKFFRLKDRRMIVENGGTLAIIELALNPSLDTRMLAIQTLAYIASEPCLQLPLLQSGVHILLGILLQSDLVEDRCMAIEVADLLAGATCFGESPSAWYDAWARAGKRYEEVSEADVPTSSNRSALRKGGALAKKTEDLGKLSTFRRALDPGWRMVDAAALIIDRRRDGGLLRWLRYQLQANDGIVRLGATMVLLKLASGVANPQIAFVQEKRTFHENLKGFTSKFSLRREQFLSALLHNLSDLDTAGLQIASLQLLAQLCACKATRYALIAAGLPQRILQEVGGIYGLLGIVLMSSQSLHPVRLQDVSDYANMEAPSLTVRGHQLPLLGILELDIFASEAELRQCTEASILALVSSSKPVVSRAAMQTLIYRFDALTPLLEFLFVSEPVGLLERVELVSSAALTLSRTSNVCGTEILESISENHQLQRLMEPLTILLGDKYEYLHKSVQDLVLVASAGGCQALCSIARGTAREDVARCLQQAKYVAFLSECVFRFAHETHTLYKDLCCQAASLLGALCLYQGLEKESLSDLLSETKTDAPCEEDDDLDDADESVQRRALISRARQNAKKAAEQGLRSLGWADVRSRLPTQKARELGNEILESCGPCLLKALQNTKDLSMQTSVCYALSRFASVYSGAKRLLEMDAIGPVIAMLPGRAEIGEDNKPNEEHAERLAALPASFFTFCAGLARTYKGKIAMISSDVLRHAVDVLCLISPDYDPRLHGEAALVIARVANTHDAVYGSCNEMILRGRYNCAKPLMNLATGSKFPFRVRFHALLALAQMTEDDMLAIPKLTRVGIMPAMCKLVQDLEQEEGESVDCLLTQALRILHALVSYLMGIHQGRILDEGVEPVLQRLSSRKSIHSKEKSNSQPTVAEIARTILEGLSLTLTYGPKVAHEIRATPGLEPEEPLIREIIDEETSRADLTDHVGNPFGDRLELGTFYSTRLGRLCKSNDIEKCSPRPRRQRIIDMREEESGEINNHEKIPVDSKSPRDFVFAFGVSSSIISSEAEPSASKFRQQGGAHVDLRLTRPPPRQSILRATRPLENQQT